MGTAVIKDRSRSDTSGIRHKRKKTGVRKTDPPPARTEKRPVPGVDKGILIPLLALVALGLLMVVSASTYTSVIEDQGYISFVKQFIFVALGLTILYFLSRADYHLWDNMTLAWILMGISAILLLLVLIIGDETNGAKRWIDLGFISFQPSEIAKFSGCIYMAATITHYPEVTEEWLPLLWRCILPMAVICGLTAAEPSLSAAIAVAVPMAVILFLSVRKLRLLIPYLLIGVGTVIALMVFTGWRLDRLLSFFGGGDPDYQITQSLLAIASGGIFGKGLGNGIQKYLFLPELENDFIFANVGEELGLLGCLIIIGLFAALVYRGLRQALYAQDRFGLYYTAGVIVLIACQAIMNICVAVSVLPVTGVALPFVSAGGTSLIILLGMMGPILNLTRQTRHQTAFLTKVLKR